MPPAQDGGGVGHLRGVDLPLGLGGLLGCWRGCGLLLDVVLDGLRLGLGEWGWLVLLGRWLLVLRLRLGLGLRLGLLVLLRLGLGVEIGGLGEMPGPAPRWDLGLSLPGLPLLGLLDEKVGMHFSSLFFLSLRVYDSMYVY